MHFRIPSPNLRNASAKNKTFTNTTHPFAFQRSFGMPKSTPPARADNRGGQRELHGAGVGDFHDVARPGRRERAEERPVQPVLTVKLDDLRKKPRNSRCARGTRRTDGKIHFLVARFVQKML